MNKRYLILAFLISLCLTGIQSAGQEKRDSIVTDSPWQISRNFWKTVSSERSLTEKDLGKGPATDLRSMLTGLITGYDITESDGSLAPESGLGSIQLNTWKFNGSSRGFSSVICIADDVPVAFNQLLLDPNQIESVTLLTDVASKALYGPMASYGALLIRTKKGGYNTPMSISLDMESGVSFTGRIPEWVNGEEYARLNNAAREASGNQVLYDERALAGFAAGNPYDMEYPSVDWRFLMIREAVPVNRFGLNINGGSAKVKYNASLNGLNSGDIYKVGPVSDYSKLTMSTSITAKIGRYLEANASFNGMLGYRRGNNASFTSYRDIPGTAFPLALGRSSGLSAEENGLGGSTVYAVSRTFTENPYARLVDGGFYTGRYRSGMFNVSVDLDMSWLLKGLKSRTFVNLNSFYWTKTGKENDYLAYYWDAAAGLSEISDHKGVKESEKKTMATYTYQGLNLYERLTYDWEKNGHKVNAGAMYWISSVARTDNTQYERQQNFMANAEYSWKDRYIVQAMMSYAGSSRFKKGHRYGTFPAGAVAWVVSEEPFMKNARAINNFKIHAQAGLIGSADVFGTSYLYEANYTVAAGRYYGPSGESEQWYGSDRYRSYPTTIKRLENPELSWSRIFQTDLGIDIELLNCLSLTFNWFRAYRYGIIGDVTSIISGTFGMANISIYDNYSSKLTNGGEMAVTFNKKFGDFSLKAGVSASTWKITDTKVISDLYEYEWQKKTGADDNAIWGYNCIGRFQTQEQLDNSPKYSSSAQIGDLMYEDLNKDGKIDVNDQKIIGSSAPKLRYAVNIGFSWKNLDLYISGTGRAFYQIPMTNEYFWNGWGDANYSAFVRDNIRGAYPRLNYNKATDNFLTSTFWLKDGGYFKIQDIEIGYTCPFRKAKGLKSLRISLKGSNLCTISKIKDVDPESINSGVTAYPLMRTFTAGIKLNF